MLSTYGHFRDVPLNAWTWPNFIPAEMADSKDRSLVVYAPFMDWLQELRIKYDRPIIVSSGYRTPQHQQTLPGCRITGAHVDAMAVDIRVHGQHALELLAVATRLGVLGVGVHQTGPVRNRYIHLDMWHRAPAGLRPTIWSY